jgi:H+/Cl- antiporter ClcA
VFANLIGDRDVCRTSKEGFWGHVARVGMGAAYGVPLGCALFSLEVMRGVLALRYVLPAHFVSAVAAAVSWLALPDLPTYIIPAYSSSVSGVLWALVAGPIAGISSVGYVRLITWPIATNRRVGGG